MEETPREYKKRIDEKRAKNRKNKDELIKKIDEYELLDEKFKTLTKQKILENFSKNQKAEQESEQYITIISELSKIDQKYEELHQMEEKLNLKNEGKEQIDKEIREIKLDGADETTLMMQMAGVNELREKLEILDSEIKDLEKDIQNRKTEIKEIESTYGEISKNDVPAEDVPKETPKSIQNKFPVVTPSTLKEYHRQTVKDLWTKDKTRGEIFKLLDEGTGIDDKLREKIEKEISDRFFEYYDNLQGTLRMKGARYLKNKIRTTSMQASSGLNVEDEQIDKETIIAKTPRENREKLIMQWYEKKLNRDELLKFVERNETLDEQEREKIKSEIMKNFYENFEKAKENEEFKSADAQYMEIKDMERQVVKKHKEVIKKKELTKRELEGIRYEKSEIALSSMNLEDGSWWKKGKLMKANTRRDELTKQEKQINGKINELHREKQALLASLSKMYKSYGPKIKRSYNKGKNLGDMSQIREGLNSETTYKGHREKYFEAVKAKEEYIQNFLSEMRGLDLGISEDKKQEILEIIESNMKKEIEDLKLGDEIVKKADEIEKWLKEGWETMMQKLLDLSGEIEKQESAIKKIESTKESVSTSKLGKIIDKEFELKRNLIKMKNEYESMKNKISEDLENYDGLAVDWTKPILVETWEEKIEREEKEKRIKENTKELLKKYREAWKKMVDISTDAKEKIIKTSEEIPVKIDVDEDGSRLIELYLGGTIYEIVDVNTDNYSDSDQMTEYQYNGINKKGVYVSGLRGNKLNDWGNKKLANFIKEQGKNGLYIPKSEDIKNLLSELGKQTGVDDESDQVLMLMYITGFHGCYYLQDAYIRLGLASRGIRDRADANNGRGSSIMLLRSKGMK